tara:strand:+ start:28210 stop:28524 length:315 start_codon:yes stop_codon:yes gene_type:complete
MPYVNKPRPYKKEYQQQIARGENKARLERQRARETVDKKNADSDGNGIADIREGKDVAHRVAISKGGANKNGTRLETPSKNRSFKRASNHKVVSETSTKERKKK